MGSVLVAELFDLWQTVIGLELPSGLEGFIETSPRTSRLDLGFDRAILQ
jgi:hypothetical protein